MPNALIITTSGINCDRELAEAFELAGATAEFRHLNRLLAHPDEIDRFDLIGLPGGFSYGDAIAAGRVCATMMRQRLYPALRRALDRGVPMIAPCNGFQIAARIGLLPGAEPGAEPASPPRPSVTLARNRSARFVDRWVRMEIPASTRCIWTQGIELDEATGRIPVAHGEGRFIPAAPELLDRLDARGQIALRYAEDDNPNGSVGDVAGICDPTGLLFGLMPHPERFTRWTQHPFWSRLDLSRLAADPPGLRMFRNAVEHARQPTAV